MADTQHLLAEEPARRDEKHAADALSREPVKNPEALAEANAIVDKAEQDSKKPEGLIGREISRFRNELSGWRRATINAMPSFLVNYSSNILGASHIVTEVAMFKASNAKDSNFKLVQDRGNPLSYITDPLKQTWKGTHSGAKFKTPVREVFSADPNKTFVGNAYDYLTNTKRADAREYARAEKTLEDIADNKKPKSALAAEAIHANRWQTRSTLAGIVVWTLSTFIPDKKEDPAEVDRMAELQQRSPVGYLAERLRQAVWVPEWPQHKRQMIGLGVMASGLCSFMGAWRVRKQVFPGVYSYMRDNSYLMTSLFTFGSATALTFSLDDERGFSRFGMGMMGRLLFLPKSISNRYANNDPGKNWYAGATASFQLENMAQSLIGGAEKNPDGTIIDHASIRQEAKLKAKVKSAARTLGEPITEEELNQRVEKLKHAKPSTLVSGVAEREMAMPERVAAQEQQMAAV
ncbi:MAG: hypothetical protein DI582_08885 [Azospirillum brasilense]|nr:MAG: hypothetical protein DI582_08885 [Azospirillum brasilense]